MKPKWGNRFIHACMRPRACAHAHACTHTIYIYIYMHNLSDLFMVNIIVSHVLVWYCFSLLFAPKEFASPQLVWERICSDVILTRPWSQTFLALCGLWSSLCLDWTWQHCQEHSTKLGGEIIEEMHSYLFLMALLCGNNTLLKLREQTSCHVCWIFMATEFSKIFSGCQLHQLVQISQYFRD
jgi:hypothetical protein